MPDASVRRLWCERALLADGVAEGVTIEIEDGLVTAVARGTDAGGAERLAGITLPGFANAHSHAFHRALRGRTHGGQGDFWTWRRQMYSVAARLTPDNYRELAAATFAEMLRAGYTSVGEFHYVHHQPDGTPYAEPNAMGLAIIDAARATGIRLTLLDGCYLRAGARQPVLAEQARFSDGTAAAWVERVGLLADDAMVRIGAAVHSVRAVDAESIGVIAEHARRRSMPLHAHVSEQVAENEQVFEEYECTPTELLARQGALSEHFTAVHATHLQEIDIELLAARRCVCCFCPTTERDLADGIGPSARLRTAGVRLSIGSDQHAAIDPFEEMRGIEMNERLRSHRRGTHPASELIVAGTVNGHASLGWPTGGRIEVGALADLTTIALDSVRLAGCDRRGDALLDALVFAASAADVCDVIVGGRTVVRSGKHVSIDIPDALASSIGAVTDGAWA